MRHISRTYSTTIRAFALAAVSLLASSCQTEPREPEGRTTYSAKVHPIDGEHRQPDRVGWKIGDDSGSAAVAGSGSVVQISLATRPTGDVWLDLWRAGVRFMQLKYKNNSGSTLEYASEYKIDNVATSILQLIHPASDSATFVKKFAELLVANDTIVSKMGFPQSSIVGVDKEAVLNEAMKIMVQSGKRLDSVIPSQGGWALGISPEAVHERVKNLVASGAITKDTNALFPPAPLRVNANISMAAQIQAGGQAVNVSGIFEATTKIVACSVKVFQNSVDVSGGFQITEPDVTGRPQILDLEGKLSIVAKKSALSGTYRLEIVLEDDEGHTVRAVFAFEVLSAIDDEGPQVRIKSPVDGTGFGYEVLSVLVKADAIDPSGVDSVKINGNIAGFREAEFVYDLALEAGKSTEILVEAWDKLKNRGATSVSVSRKGPPDTSAPRLKLLGPANGAEFPIETPTTTLKWLVSDLLGLSDTGVKIDGKIAQRNQDTFSLVVDLPAPGQSRTYRVDAINTKGISNYETVVLKRAADKTPPQFTRIPGTGDTTVPYATTSYVLGWKVTDNVSLASVSVDGKEISKTGDAYTTTISLPRIGEYRVGMVAKDASGNLVTDSVVLRRAYHDSIPPRFVRGAGTKDTSVHYETTSYALAWTVTDNGQVKSVTIGGQAVVASGSSYAGAVNLANGTNTVVMVALDTAGNEARDTVVIQRATDAGAPVIVRQAGTKDSTVGYTTSAIALSWKITDDVGVASVTINGKPATGTAGIYSYALGSLQVGATGVKVVAKDAAGKESTDSITITRKDDAGAPVIVRQTGTKDSVVGYTTGAIVLSWKITDDVGIAGVTINDKPVTGTAGIYSYALENLQVGATGVKVVAKDAAGKESTDSITITRKGDVGAPVITPETGTMDQGVPYATTTAKLSWKVVDDNGIDQVTINGSVATGANGIYTLNATGLKIGANEFTLIAKDIAGKQASHKVTITRAWKDTINPEVVRQSGTGPVTVPYATTSVALSWKVTDTLLDSVKIQGALKTGTGGIYSATVSLPVGSTTIVLQAKDKQGNVAKDEFVVIRNAAAPVHSAKPGKYIGTVYDTITAAGSASIEYSADGVTWQLAPKGIVSFNTTGKTTLYARSLPGEVVSSIELEISQIKSVSGGGNHSGFVKTDGTLWMTGSNQYGQLGKGDKFESKTPVQVLSGIPIQAVVLGQDHSWALGVNLRAYGAGTGSLLALGADDVVTFKEALRDVVGIGAGGSQSLMIGGRGDLSGIGSWIFKNDIDNPSGEIYFEVTMSNIAAVDGGPNFSLALGQDGVLWGNGYSRFGQAGMCGPECRLPETMDVDVATMAAGGSHTLVVKKDGSLWTVGENLSGQLGVGDYTADNSYSKVFSSGVSRVDAGSSHSLVLMADGRLLATGSNYMGQLGIGPIGGKPSFTEVATDVTMIAAGSSTSFFVKKDGTLWGMGSNVQGELGLGSVESVDIPTRLNF